MSSKISNQPRWMWRFWWRFCVFPEEELRFHSGQLKTPLPFLPIWLEYLAHRQCICVKSMQSSKGPSNWCESHSTWPTPTYTISRYPIEKKLQPDVAREEHHQNLTETDSVRSLSLNVAGDSLFKTKRAFRTLSITVAVRWRIWATRIHSTNHLNKKN